MTALRLRLEPKGGTTWCFLEGEIDETADFSPVEAIAGPIVLELSGIARINSVGVREWLHFARRVTAKSAVTLERCSAAIVEQLDLIANFPAAARVGSIEAPVECTRCGAEAAVTVRCDEASPRAFAAGTCTACGAPRQPAIEPERLFAFLGA